MLTTGVILAEHHKAFSRQIDRRPEHALWLPLHAEEIGASPRGARREGYQHVEIAVGSKVIAKDGVKKGKLGDFPSATEWSNPVYQYLQAVMMDDLARDSPSSEQALSRRFHSPQSIRTLP
jgi:hypothetical protein